MPNNLNINQIYQSVFVNNTPSTKPKDTSKHWQLSFKGKDRIINKTFSKEEGLIISITPEGGQRVFIEGTKDGRCISMHNASPHKNSIIASYDPYYHIALIGERHEQKSTSNGLPLPITRDAIGLIKELKDLIQSSPEMCKKNRYVDLIKPRVDAFLDLFNKATA